MRSLTALLLLVATVVLVVCAPGCHAYNVRYSIVTTDPTLSDPDSAGCSAQDRALHMAMPPTALGQALALQTAGTASVMYLPLGGEARTAQCSDKDCLWVWNDGLYYMNPYTFFTGIVFLNSSNLRFPTSAYDTDDNGTAYCNFDVCANPSAGAYPAYDDGQSYWGNRKVAMLRSTGGWQNVAYNTSFVQWLCEAYEFQVDSVVNDSARFGLAMWPASHEGDILIYPAPDVSTYQYCPNAPKKRIKIKSNTYVFPDCSSSFPWWGGLIIAIICFLILVAVIMVVWCCCFCKIDEQHDDDYDDDDDDDDDDDEEFQAQRNNKGPTIVQTGAAPRRADTFSEDSDDDYDDEYSDKDSHSRE